MILNQVKRAKQTKQTNIKTLLFINLTLATCTKSAISSIFKIQILFCFVLHATYMSSSFILNLIFILFSSITVHASSSSETACWILKLGGQSVVNFESFNMKLERTCTFAHRTAQRTFKKSCCHFGQQLLFQETFFYPIGKRCRFE